MTPVKGELVHASAIYTAITESFVSAVGTKSCYIMSKDVSVDFEQEMGILYGCLSCIFSVSFYLMPISFCPRLSN